METIEYASKVKRAGALRWLIVTMLFAASALNFADRTSLGFAKKGLSDDFKIDIKEFSNIMLVWGIAYALAQVPAGKLLDRFGTKRVYGIALLLWSLLEMSYGFVGYLPNATMVVLTMIAVTFLLGLMESPAFPGNARIVAQWFPAAERGTASSFFNSSQYFSQVVFAPLMGIVAYYLGWHCVFWVMGAIGLALVVVWFKVIHSPREHPWMKEAELEYIREGGALVDVTHGKSAPKTGWFYAKQLLANRMLIGVYIAQFAITTMTFFYVQWLIPYLMDDRKLNILQAGFVAAMPHIFGFVGSVSGGIVSDFMLRRGFSLTASRKTVIIVGMAMAAAIVLCNFVEVEWMIVAVLCFAFFGKGFGAIGWTVVSDTAPKQVLGLAGGIFNMFGNMAQVALAIFVGNFVVPRPTATTAASGLASATAPATSSAGSSFDLVIWYVGCSAVAALLSYLFLVGKIERVVLKEPPAETQGFEVVPDAKR